MPQAMMRVTHASSFDDVEELRRRFEEFRSQHRTRTRLPEELWRAAAEIAERRGMNLVCRCLRLDSNSLKKWMGKRVHGPSARRGGRKGSAMAGGDFYGTAGARNECCRELHRGSRIATWRQAPFGAERHRNQRDCAVDSQLRRSVINGGAKIDHEAPCERRFVAVQK